jgi:hypothetical protein
MAALCVEAADEILRLRSRYAALRRANSIALRELVAGRQKDEAAGGKPIVTEWVASREMIIDASS